MSPSDITFQLKARWPEYANRTNKSLNVSATMARLRKTEASWMGSEEDERGWWTYWNKRSE